MERSNIYDAVEFQKNMLQRTGCWPKRNKTFFYRFRQFLSWTTDLTFYVTLVMELNQNLMEQDYKHMTELISFMASPTSYIMKHFIFALHANKFMTMLERLSDDIFNNYPLILDKHIKNTNKYARFLMRSYQYLVALLVLLYFLKPFFTKDSLAIRFSVYELGNWWFAYHCFQVASIGLACWNNSSLDILALGVIAIASAQFEILRDKLLNIRKWAGLKYEEVEMGKTNENENMSEEIDGHVEERLKQCVKHHLEIIKYSATIEEIYTYYFLVQFIDSVIAICNTWFQFRLADDLLNIVFLIFYSIVLVMQLGIYCIYGNNLMQRSSEIKDACYSSDWYNCGMRPKKALMIIMERSKRPTVLTAGKISVLGLASYSNLLQSSYSYFALMNRLYD